MKARNAAPASKHDDPPAPRTLNAMTPEQIIAHAEIAATFLRSLTDKGVPMSAAVPLTSSYLQTVAITESVNRNPKEPWEGA